MTLTQICLFFFFFKQRNLLIPIFDTFNDALSLFITQAALFEIHLSCFSLRQCLITFSLA